MRVKGTPLESLAECVLFEIHAYDYDKPVFELAVGVLQP